MKKNIFLIGLLIIVSLAKGQKDSVIKNKKMPKAVADSVVVNISDQSKLNIDTLYLKSLNSTQKDEESIWIKLLPLFGVILGGAITWIAQTYSNKQEKEINSHNLKEAKRIQSIENIFSSINSMSLLDRNSTAQLLTEIKNLEKYANENALYIDKPYEKIVEDICDYYKTVAIDFRNKNYLTEIGFTEELKKLFNK